MRPVLFDDLRQIDDLRKTANISAELSRLNVDIAAQQETRLADSSMLRLSDYTLSWQGRAEEEARLYGVRFAMKNSLLSAIEPPTRSTARILAILHLHRFHHHTQRPRANSLLHPKSQRQILRRARCCGRQSSSLGAFVPAWGFQRQGRGRQRLLA